MFSIEGFKATFEYIDLFKEGVICTISLSALTVFFGFLLALILALMRMSKIMPLRAVAAAYVELFRATPMLVQIMLVYNVFLAPFDLPAFKLFGFIRFERFLPGVIALSLNSGAYLSGIVVDALPNAMFKVDIGNGHTILAHISGKLRMNFIKILPGDKVTIQMSPYDLTQGRITWRSK